MARIPLVGLMAFCLGAAGPVWAGSTVVSNPTPVVSASMDLIGADDSPNNGCPEGQTLFIWSVNGKVKPTFRGFGSGIKLVCTTFDALEQGGVPPITFPRQCDGNGCVPTPASPDACGNFTFNAEFCGTSPQLDNRFVCTFVAHIDGSATPQACNKAPAPDAVPPDPNGSGPCAGGLCPGS